MIAVITKEDIEEVLNCGVGPFKTWRIEVTKDGFVYLVVVMENDDEVDYSID